MSPEFGGRPAPRGGFTLIEVVVSLVLISLVVLGMGAALPTMVRTTTRSGIDFLTLNAVEDRLQLVLIDPRYFQLDSLYDGAVEEVPYLPGFERVTRISRNLTVNENGRTTDVTYITVTVSSELHERAVTRTVARAAP